MGKGDIKTRRGKISNGSYGKRRPKKSSVKTTKPVIAEVKPEVKPEVKVETKAKKNKTSHTKPD